LEIQKSNGVCEVGILRIVKSSVNDVSDVAREAGSRTVKGKGEEWK
jgi:hypothetical protein